MGGLSDELCLCVRAYVYKVEYDMLFTINAVRTFELEQMYEYRVCCSYAMWMLNTGSLSYAS